MTDGSGQDRALLRKARHPQRGRLAIKDGKRHLPNGDAFKVEFLYDEPSLNPHHGPYIKNLVTLGIEATSAWSMRCSIARGSRTSIST